MIWAILTQSKLARYAGAAVFITAIVLWLRWDAVSDFRQKQESAANEARIEHMEGAKNVERKIEGLDRDGFNDAIDGLPRRDHHPTTVQ